MDNMTTSQRSLTMSKIRSRDTQPEIKLRSFLHKAGYRFRKNVKKLPGTPDIVLPKYKAVIFVHGCFWHKHDCKHGWKQPKTNTQYWKSKIDRNVARDKKNIQELIREGWKVLIIWECETMDLEKLSNTIDRFLCDN